MVKENWAHARRNFEACHHFGPTKQTKTALTFLQQLFCIEAEYRTCFDDERLAARLEKSAPIVYEFHDWLKSEQKRQLPKSKLMNAINYPLNCWDSFEVFLQSGAVPTDNNAAERALKYPILVRKAWLLFGNPTAGETAAKMFTQTKTCDRHRIDPFMHLQDVFQRIPIISAEELCRTTTKTPG